MLNKMFLPILLGAALLPVLIPLLTVLWNFAHVQIPLRWIPAVLLILSVQATDFFSKTDTKNFT